ncbi:unnamed protein product [Amoebophrya sp. A25]|nr:unnamed protein product [Amoebophrya sp. A25]|eukprot:GSA25T00004903001.1
MTNRKGKLREKHSMSPSMEDKGGPAPPGASEIVSEKVTQEKSQPSRILNKSDKDNTSSMKSVDLRQAADLRVANTDGNSSIKSTKLPKAKPGARVLDGETGKASSMKSVDLRKAADLRVANTDGNPSIKSTKLPKKKRVLDGESVNMPSTETSEASIIADLRKETPENNVFSDAVLFNVVATDVKGALRILAAAVWWTWTAH